MINMKFHIIRVHPLHVGKQLSWREYVPDTCIHIHVASLNATNTLYDIVKPSQLQQSSLCVERSILLSCTHTFSVQDSSIDENGEWCKFRSVMTIIYHAHQSAGPRDRGERRQYRQGRESVIRGGIRKYRERIELQLEEEQKIQCIRSIHIYQVGKLQMDHV